MRRLPQRKWIGKWIEEKTVTCKLADGPATSFADHALDLIYAYKTTNCLVFLVTNRVLWTAGRLVHTLKYSHSFFRIVLQLISLTHSQFKLITNKGYPWKQQLRQTPSDWNHSACRWCLGLAGRSSPPSSYRTQHRRRTGSWSWWGKKRSLALTRCTHRLSLTHKDWSSCIQRTQVLV